MMISKEKYIEGAKRIEGMCTTYLARCLKEDQDLVINGETPEIREKAMHRLIADQYDYDRHLPEVKVDIRDINDKYQDMIDMTDALSKAFACEWIDELSFAVKTNHERLSDFAIMLEKWFKIRSISGFTFSSSFTTHNGATEHDLCLDITCTKDGRGLIIFKGFSNRYPYWLSDKFIEEYEKFEKEHK
jgi:hypothetical protein